MKATSGTTTMTRSSASAPKRKGSSRALSYSLAAVTLIGTTGLLAYQELERAATAAPETNSDVTRQDLDTAAEAAALQQWQDDLVAYQTELSAAALQLEREAEKLRSADRANAARVSETSDADTPVLDAPPPELDVPVVVKSGPTRASDPAASGPQWAADPAPAPAPNPPDASSRAS